MIYLTEKITSLWLADSRPISLIIKKEFARSRQKLFTKIIYIA